MRSFWEFNKLIIEREDFSDEVAHEHLWNYILGVVDRRKKEGREIRKAVRDGDWDKVRNALNQLVNDLKDDPNHKLNFSNVDNIGFTGAGGEKTDDHLDSYHSRMERGVHGVLTMLKSRQGRSLGSQGANVSAEGGKHTESEDDWEGNPGGQGRVDLVYRSKDNKKVEHRQSAKASDKRSQAYSAQGDQLAAQISAAADEVSKGDEEKSNKIKQVGKSIGARLDQMKGLSREDQKKEKEEIQKALSDLDKEHPGVGRAVGQEGLTGTRQYGRRRAVQSVIGLGSDDGQVKRPREVPVSQPRARLPKGENRPGAASGDIGKESEIRADQQSRQQSGGLRGWLQQAAERDRAAREKRLLQIRKEIERRKKSGERVGPHFTSNQMGNGLPEDKYLKLSQGMKTFSEFVLECSQLDEGGLSRLVGQAKKKGVAVLSGTRGDKSSKENKARNQQLVKDIRGKGLPGPTKAKGKWEGGSERSHIVTSGKQGKRAFKDKVKSLGVKYDQDAVITQSPGKSATLTRTSKDGMDKKRRSIGKMRPGKSNPKNETQIKGKTFTYEK